MRPLNGFKACLEKKTSCCPPPLPPLIIRLCLDRLAYCCPLCRKDFSMGVCAGGLQRGVLRGGSDSQLRSVVLLRLIPNYVTLSSVVCVYVYACVCVCVCERERYTHGNHEKIHQFNMCTLIIKRYFSSEDCRIVTEVPFTVFFFHLSGNVEKRTTKTCFKTTCVIMKILYWNLFSPFLYCLFLLLNNENK